MNWRAVLRSRDVLGATIVLAAVLAVWGATLAAATRPPTMDDRITAVARQLQCLPCQGESVADSPSAWALQVRGVIRAQLRAGRTEPQVVQYFVARYGDSIRQDPPKSGFTLLMWLGPLAALLAGALVVGLVARRWRALETGIRPPGDDGDTDGVPDADLEPYRALLAAELDGGQSTRSGQHPEVQRWPW
jgi:cytochrome c-type biogenesis protein CcmH